MLLCGVLEQLSQLQWVFADLLHRGEQEAIQGDVNHLLEQPAGLEEVPVLALLHEVGQLHTGTWVVVAVLRIDGKALLLEGKTASSVSGWEPPVRTLLEKRGGMGQDSKGNPSLAWLSWMVRRKIVRGLGVVDNWVLFKGGERILYHVCSLSS